MEPPHRGTSALEAPIYVLERGGAGQTDSPTQFQTGPTAGGEEATELQVCALERQLSGASSADSVSSVCDRSDDGGGGTALFANQVRSPKCCKPAPFCQVDHKLTAFLPLLQTHTPQACVQDQDEPPIGQQQPPVPPVQPQHLAATLRSAQQATGTQQAGVAREVEGLTASPKHVFVFSTAGKPIYSYRGDESRLAGLMATAEAILSVAHSKGHTLKHVRYACARAAAITCRGSDGDRSSNHWGSTDMLECRSPKSLPHLTSLSCSFTLTCAPCRAGQHVFAFLERPPLCLVGVSALAEPPAVMRMQVCSRHGHACWVLPKPSVKRCSRL